MKRIANWLVVIGSVVVVGAATTAHPTAAAPADASRTAQPAKAESSSLSQSARKAAQQLKDPTAQAIGTSSECYWQCLSHLRSCLGHCTDRCEMCTGAYAECQNFCEERSSTDALSGGGGNIPHPYCCSKECCDLGELCKEEHDCNGWYICRSDNNDCICTGKACPNGPQARPKPRR